MIVEPNAQVIHNRVLAPGIHGITVHCPELAQEAQPGQFVQIQEEGFFLRRPISLAEINREAGTLTLIVEERGAGTAKLCQTAPGRSMNLLGPLGRGFTLLHSDAPVLIIGGGIGVPPLLPLGRYYGSKASVVLGFRTASAAILLEEFRGFGCHIVPCTDDGTLGTRGLVTEPVKELLSKHRPQLVYACGPMPMLGAVGRLAREWGVRCQVSMEQRMACGVGACLVCSCPVVDAEGKPDGYKQVCQHGPVFEGEEILWG